MREKTYLEKLIAEPGLQAKLGDTDKEILHKVFDMSFYFIEMKIHILKSTGLNIYKAGQISAYIDTLEMLLNLCARAKYTGSKDGHRIHHNMHKVKELKEQVSKLDIG